MFNYKAPGRLFDCGTHYNIFGKSAALNRSFTVLCNFSWSNAKWGKSNTLLAVDGLITLSAQEDHQGAPNEQSFNRAFSSSLILVSNPLLLLSKEVISGLFWVKIP